MNKRAIFILALIIIFCIFFYFGFRYQRNNKQEEIIKNDMIFDENKNEPLEETIEATSQDETITPNTTLILKKYYTKCKHTITNNVAIPEEMVNLSKEELKEKYKDWEIEKFSKDEIILKKNLEEFCNEHYYLKEENGHVNIYNIDENGKLTLKEENRLSCEYLPETDRIELRNGIEINTKEELNKILEDFES